MRLAVPQIGVLTVAALICIHGSTQALQNQPEAGSQTLCTASRTPDNEPAAPEILIAEVNFSGSLRMTIADEQEIANAVASETRGTSPDKVIDEALERVKVGWQDPGYFKVEVTGDTKVLTSNPVSQRVALNVHVEEGSEYRLNSIKFKNNKAISDTGLLRSLFPIADGEIFSREKIAKGLENLRKAYGELGYLNFTSVPDTSFDDANNRIALDVDFDEGKQFRIGKINVLGLEQPLREELLRSLSIKPGDIYSSVLWTEIVSKQAPMLPGCDCPDHETLREDNALGVVT
jgi:outer membrane protein assembly factor BamA